VDSIYYIPYFNKNDSFDFWSLLLQTPTDFKILSLLHAQDNSVSVIETLTSHLLPCYTTLSNLKYIILKDIFMQRMALLFLPHSLINFISANVCKVQSA